MERGAQISDRAAGLSFIALGGILFSATLAVAATRLVFLARARTAEATIVGELAAPGRHGTVHCPVLSYTPAGSTHAVTVESDRCHSATPHIGDKTRVLYDPSAPDEAVPNEGYALVLGLVASFAAAGIGFVVAGVILFRRHARRRLGYNDAPPRRD